MNSNTNFIDFVSKTTDKLNSNKDIANEFRLNNLSKLKQIGLPTHRKGNEEWKYTNLNKNLSNNKWIPMLDFKLLYKISFFIFKLNLGLYKTSASKSYLYSSWSNSL